MRVRPFVLGSACAVAFAVVGACASFGGDTPQPIAPDAGPDAPVVVPPLACPDGPRLVEAASAKPDAQCGPNGALVDLSSHDHCGACGHACGAGTCSNGMCSPERLLADESLAAAHVVGTTVHFVNTKREAGRADIAAAKGKPYSNSLLVTNTSVRRMQVAGNWLYISTSDGSHRFALDDSVQERVPLDGGDPVGVVAAEANGYFYATGSGVERQSKSGISSVSSPGTSNVVADGDMAYWITANDAGAAVHGPFPTTDPPLTSAAASAVAMAVDASHVYFADPTARLIRRIARAGGSLQSVATESSQRTGDLAVDGDYVYWTADRGAIDGWVVMRVAKCGGLPLVLAKVLPEVTQLSFDATYVYTVRLSNGRGDLIRIAK